MNVGSVHDTEEQKKKFIVSVPKKNLLYYKQEHKINFMSPIENFVYGGMDILIIAEDLEFEIEKSIDIGEMDGKMFKHIYIKEKEG